MSASRASESRPTGPDPMDGEPRCRPAGTPTRPGASERAEDVPPDGGLPCVWMTAGLLRYRLCDREYDCECCPLDAALGGDRPLSADHAAEPRHQPLEFPDDRRYSSTHGWLRMLESGRARWGLDVLVGRLLDRVTAVVLPAVGSHTRRGQPLCWLVDAGVPVPLASPVSGTVAAVNARVQSEPSLVTSSPYDEGWLIELSATSDLESRDDLLDAAALRRVTAGQLRGLHREGLRHVQRARQDVGPTLCDGGLPVRGLRRALGTPRYHRLVRRVLG